MRKGSRLNQLRIRHGSPSFSDTQLRCLREQSPLVAMDDGKGEPNIDDGLASSIALKGSADAGRRIGFRAKKHTGLIDVDKVAALDPADYWEPIEANSRGDMVLDPDEFYILVSRERVAIPPDHAAEMVPFNPWSGNFASIMPASLIPDSVMRRAPRLARVACWECARGKFLSSWSMAQSSAGWCSSA